MTSSARWCSRICSSSSMKSSLVCSLRNSSAKSRRAPSSSRIALSVALLSSRERLEAEAGDRAVVGDRAQKLADRIAQLLDLLARVLGAVEAIDALGAVLELLREVGEGLLELVE